MSNLPAVPQSAQRAGVVRVDDHHKPGMWNCQAKGQRETSNVPKNKPCDEALGAAQGSQGQTDLELERVLASYLMN